MSKKKLPKDKKKTSTTKAKSTKTRVNKKGWSIFQRAQTDVRDDLYRKVFWISFAVIAVITLVMAVQTGINEDEKFHYPYADALLDYYGTFGKDKRVLDLEFGKIVLYGGFVDILTGIGNKITGFEQGSPGYGAVRHVFIGLIGLLSLLFTGLLGKQIGGWRAGIIALLIIFLCPRFLGHTGLNPRDMPFASGYIMSLYFMVRFFGEIPRVSWKTVAGLAAGLALAFATRSGGLILFAFFGLFGLVHMWRSFADKSVGKSGLFMSYIKYGGVASVGGYVLALLCWPFGLAAPIDHVLQSLTEFSNYKTVLRMLFNGEMIWSSDVAPASYIFTWLGIALPLLLLLGLVLFLIFSKGVFTKNNRFYVGMLAFAFVFPVLYILYKQSNLYTGMRHLLFLVPPLVVLAALGWDYTIRKFEESNKTIALVVAGSMGILALFPLSHIFMNFKTTYVYFNELAGGVKGALGKYEMDYWGVSQKAAINWMEKEGLFDTDEPIRLRTNSNFVAMQYADKFENVKVGYARFRERYEREWDYAIFINQFIDGAHLRTGNYMDNNVIKVIGKNGTPFCMIYKNTDERLATNGFKALKANNPDEAIQLFEKEVAENPNNENAWNGLGQAYFNKQVFDKALSAFSSALELNPGSQVANSYTSLVLLNQNRLDEALVYLDKAIELNNRDFNSKYYRGMVYARKGNEQKAIDELKSVLQMNPTHKPTYQLLIQIYNQKGDKQNANYFQQLMARYVR